MSFRTRFAPSPTGPLHLGHAYSAITAHDMARANGGEFLLRIEDIDQSRARTVWEELIFEDLDWLGLSWDGPVMRQSDRIETYRAALENLWNQKLLFSCTCNRRDVIEAASAPHGGPVYGPDGIIYPGTCRQNSRQTDCPKNQALRLDMAASASDISFEETGEIPQTVQISRQGLIEGVGDVVLARRDMGTSYHLSVVLDDADQGITHVVRGLDLFEVTQIHVTLQKLLHLPTPIYHHHRLITDEAGKRLAKRDDARSIKSYREAGKTPEDIRKMLELTP